MKATVVKIKEIKPHPHTDKMQIITFHGHPHVELVTGIHYSVGELGLWIKDGEIIPNNVAREMWLYQRLAGKQKNRVKAKLMKGVWSDGIFYGIKGGLWQESWRPGDEINFKFDTDEDVDDAYKKGRGAPIIEADW